MDFNPVVFDISSDEEPAFDELRGGDDDHEWLTGLLQTVDRGFTDAETDADDDVVVVGDYIPAKSKSKPLKVVKDVVVDDDDDDCVVLDGDPDKAVKVADEPADDGDEVLVVGETGQIACRDYPHPRHLCAKFPFTSTPHEQHCNLCHCYVCDSLAPCPHWGNGISTTDHCHATDKQEIWKIQRRESFRLKTNPLPVPRLPEARLPNPIAPPPQLNQVPAVTKHLAPIGRPNEVYRPTVTNVYSSSKITVPSIISQSRTPRSGLMVARRLGPCSVSQQALGVRGNTVLQNQGQRLAYRNPTTFKRPGLVRSVLTKNQPVYSSSTTNYPPPPPCYVAATNPRWQTQNGSANPVPGPFVHPSPAQPVVQPEFRSVPVTHSSNNQNVFQPVNPSQNVADSSFSDFEFWINNLDQSIQQASAENTQPQPPLQPQPQPVPSVSGPPADNPMTSSQLGGTVEPVRDNEVENWLLNQSEGLAGDLNIFSPVGTAYDAGMLCFDFETSWNGLAQV